MKQKTKNASEIGHVKKDILVLKVDFVHSLLVTFPLKIFQIATVYICLNQGELRLLDYVYTRED